MNISASFVCLASLLFIAGCAAPANRTAYAHYAEYAENGRGIFGRGTSRDEVRETLGLPHRQLNENYWIYRHFGAKDGQSPHDDCNSLLVVFSADQVEDLQLINGAAERVFAARLQARADALDTMVADISGRAREMR